MAPDPSRPTHHSATHRTARPAAFLAIVFLVKVVIALQLGNHPLLQPDTGLDTTAYVDLAKRVLAGDPALGPGLYYVSPLYIYFLAAVHAVTQSFASARVVQAALGTLAVGCIFLIAGEWYGRRAAWFAAALAALTGVFTYYESLILQSSLDVFLTSAALWLLTLALKREEMRWALLAGFAFGFAALNRPNMIVAAIAVVGTLIVLRRFRIAALALAGVIAGVAPVTIRNIVVAHQWSLVSSHGGINFYIGNGEGATGYFHAVPGMRSTVEGLALDARRVAETASRRKLSDGEVSSYYSRLAWKWIGHHPAAWAGLLLRKTYAVFNAAHVSTPFSYTFYAYDARTLLRFLLAGPWLLVPLGVFGALRAAPRPWRSDYITWLAFIPAYAASVVLFFVVERYKLPLFTALAVTAGGAVEQLRLQLVTRRRKELMVSVSVVLILLVAANWPLHLDDGRAEERVRMAEYHAARAEVVESEHWTTLALEKHPDAAWVHYRVGAQLLNSKQTMRAIDHLARAEQLSPRDPRIEYLLGRALLGADRVAEAVPHLQSAIEHHVDSPLAGYDLAVALQRNGDRHGAVRALQAVNPPPDSTAVVWLQLGRRAAELNAPDVAERFLRRAVTVSPDLPQAHQLLGIDLMVLRQYAQAAAEFTAVTAVQPRNADALAMLAYCEQNLGRLDAARTHAAAALALQPAHPIARQVMGNIGPAR